VPEGHSLHRLARSLHRTFAGEAVASSSPQGRFDSGAQILTGRVLEEAEAYGKHLFVAFEGDDVVHVHLGLYGTMLRAKAPAPEPRGAVRWRLESSTWYADLRGPTACDLVGPHGRDAIVARLGPDPLRADADPERAKSRILGSRAQVGTMLMDQSVLAGVGNIYRAELLYRHGVSPFLEGRLLKPAVFDAMWADLVLLMKDGVRRGRIVTVDPSDVEALALLDADRPSPDDPELDGGEDTPQIRRRRRQTGVYVYRREGRACLRCGVPIRAQDVQGRRLYWCPGCQRLPGQRRPRARTSTT
jgi:endonuclease-8